MDGTHAVDPHSDGQNCRRSASGHVHLQYYIGVEKMRERNLPGFDPPPTDGESFSWLRGGQVFIKYSLSTTGCTPGEIPAVGWELRRQSTVRERLE